MDQLIAFNTEHRTINPRTGCAGLLELHPVSGENPVYLFKGTLSQEECEEQVGDSFDLAANQYSPGFLVWDGQESSFTLFCSNEGAGYVRITEGCSCK